MNKKALKLLEGIANTNLDGETKKERWVEPYGVGRVHIVRSAYGAYTTKCGRCPTNWYEFYEGDPLLVGAVKCKRCFNEKK